MLINSFNDSCKNNSASYLKVGDESMSVISFRMMAKGNLPHLSYILPNMEPLGTEFKTVTCYVTGDLIFIELQRVKEGMKHKKYHQEIGATGTCTKGTTEVKKRIGQKYRKGATKDCFLFDSWFS